MDGLKGFFVYVGHCILVSQSTNEKKNGKKGFMGLLTRPSGPETYLAAAESAKTPSAFNPLAASLLHRYYFLRFLK